MKALTAEGARATFVPMSFSRAPARIFQIAVHCAPAPRAAAIATIIATTTTGTGWAFVRE